MALSKPTKLPEWSSTGGNVVEPSEGKKDEGWLTDEIPPSSYENWLKKTSWQWWQWLDEKLTEGATAENLEINGSLTIFTGPLALTNAYGLYAYGKGVYPGIVGSTGNPDPALINQRVGVIGLAGTGSTTATLTNLGLYGSNIAFTGSMRNVGVGAYSSNTAVLGFGGLSSYDYSDFTDIGVLGISGTMPHESFSSYGVIGYSDTFSGVLGMGGVASLGSAAINDCGVVGVRGTLPTDTYANIGVLGAGVVGIKGIGDLGGSFVGASAGDIGIEILGGSGASAGRGGTITGGNSTGGAGGSGALVSGGDSTTAVGGIGLDVVGGSSGGGFTCGQGILSTGGSLASRTGGRGGGFFGGASTSTYDAGNGLFAKGGTADGAGNGGYGAELEGSDASATASRTPLRLVAMTVDPPAAANEEGAMYAKGGKLYFHNGAIWKEVAFA